MLVFKDHRRPGHCYFCDEFHLDLINEMVDYDDRQWERICKECTRKKNQK
jgi:hypothetical protein